MKVDQPKRQTQNHVNGVSDIAGQAATPRFRLEKQIIGEASDKDEAPG